MALQTTQIADKIYDASIVIHSAKAISPTANLEINTTAQSSLKKLPNAEPLSSEEPSFLSLQKMQQMIGRFINEKQMSIIQLAEKIGISPNKLKKLDDANYETLAPEINLPLIKLYCKTRWL